mgnify:CR=1 FL=1
MILSNNWIVMNRIIILLLLYIATIACNDIITVSYNDYRDQYNTSTNLSQKVKYEYINYCTTTKNKTLLQCMEYLESHKA